MMNINVKLFSVLRQCVVDYDPDRGVDVELVAGAVVLDLIRKLHIPSDMLPVVTCDAKILKPGDVLVDGSVLQIFQPVAGG